MDGARIKFTWGTSSKALAPWRLGLFAVHQNQTSDASDFKNLSYRAQKRLRQKTVFVSICGVLAWGSVLAAVTYLSAAAAILHVQARQAHNQTTYADIVLPTRWSTLGPLRGRAFIAQAKDAFARKDMSAGFNLLRLGVARDPGNTRARLDLASLYVLFRLRNQSDKLLLDAFAHGAPDTPFLTQAATLLAEGDNPALLDQFLQKARDALSLANRPAQDLRVIDELTIKTLLLSDRPAEAATLAARLYPESSDARLRIEVPAALAAGDTGRAVALVSDWENRRPKSEEVLTLAAGVYRKAGRYDSMQASIDKLRALNPTRPAHATFNVVQNLLAGRDPEARSALEDWFFRFDSDPRALAELARDVSQTGRDDFLARIEDVVHDHGFDPRAVVLGRLFAQIRTRDWIQAAATSKRARAMTSGLPPGDRPVFDIAITLATACADAGGGNQKTFVEAFLRSPGTLEFDHLLIEALMYAGRFDTAAELITLVEGFYPDSAYLHQVSARVQENLRSLAQADEAARPAIKTTPDHAYPDAVAFLAALDQIETANNAPDALALIHDIRKSAPPWLGGIDEALSRRELDWVVRHNDLPLLQLTIRNYLRQVGNHSQAALDLATRWHDEGRKTESLLVAREILKLKPDFEPALKALTAWDPKPVPSTAAESALTPPPPKL